MFVGNVFHLLRPDAKFYEEGCYPIGATKDPHFIIVSQAGTCRVDEKTVLAVEIKCPVPVIHNIPSL